MEETINPWKTISGKLVYDNPWITLTEYDVINPKGGKGIYGKVHMKNLAIGIVPVDKDLNTWLVGQYRYTLDQYSWEIPMGGGDLNQPPIESAKRELKEETGLIADKYSHITNIHTSNSVTDEYGYAFLAEELTEGETEFDETEDLKIWKLPLKEAIEMVMKDEITDSLSVAALLKLKIRFNL